MSVEPQPSIASSSPPRQSRSWVGRSIRRLEDERLVRGGGRYIEELSKPGMLHVAIVRSPHAHARILGVDGDAARTMPGVVAVVTVDDLRDVGTIPAALPSGRPVPEHLPLADGVARFVGEPVAAVVAERLDLARDAAEAVVVDYEPLPAVVGPAAALAAGAPLVHESLGTNEAYRVHHTAGDVDAVLARAERTASVRVRHGRVAAIPIETRGVLAWNDSSTDKLTVWLSTQAAWLERTDLAKALGISEEDLRVITPDVGGAFGAKMTAYREDVLVASLARRLGQPVRWISTRIEDLHSSMHGREAVSEGEVAFNADGHILGLRVRTIANMGAYMMKYGGGPAQRMLYFPTGAYAVEHLDADVVGVFTNTTPTGPYRGAGRPEAAFFAERMADEVAHALGLDPADVRRRNFIPPSAFPYKNAGGISYDSGEYERALELALELADYTGLRREQAARRARGEIFGIGIASTVEVSGGGSEMGEVRVGQDGAVSAVTGASPHGQSHETTFAQVIADQFGVRPDDVTVYWGDTESLPRGAGTMGSRSGTLGGNAIRAAGEEVRTRLLGAAAGVLDVAPDDLVIEKGVVSVRGVPDRHLPLADAVRRAAPDGEAVAARAEYKTEGGETFPFGTSVAAVSIDPDTGRVTIERFVGVDDCGRVINPLIVEGQLLGGIVQGIGEALHEEVRYDEHGQLLSSSLLDYAVPTASGLPNMVLERTETPSPRNPLGMKGVGESGAVAAPPTIANAVIDALRPFGVSELELPMTSERIWRAIGDGEKP